MLKTIFPLINEPATFWLDAHGPIFPGDECIDDPILNELEIIKNCGIKDHILLLDNMWETYLKTQSRLDLKNRLLSINPNYKISFIDGQGIIGPPISKSIMVAIP